MKTILQHDMRDCGAACLCMIADHFGLQLSIAQCRALTKTDQDGTTVYGIVDGAEQIGLSGDALMGTYEELRKSLKDGDVSLPFIAHIITEDGFSHFIVVLRVNEKGIFAADPAKGKRLLTEEAFLAQWTGHIVTFRQQSKRIEMPKKTRRLNMLFRLLHGQSRRLAAITLLSVFVSAIGIVGAYVFKLCMGQFTTSVNVITDVFHWRAVQSGVISLFAIFGTLLCLYLFQAFLGFLRGRLLVRLSLTIDKKLSTAFFNHIVNLPISSIQIRQTGEYMSRLSDIKDIRDAISGATITLLIDTGMVLFCGIMLARENLRLFLIALSMVLVYTVIILLYKKPIEKSSRDAMENNARVQSAYKENVDGLVVIKTATAEEIAKRKIKEKFDIFIKTLYRYSMLAFSQDLLAGTVETIGTVLILWTGFSMVSAGVMSNGSVVTFYALLAYFTAPIKNLIGLQPMLQKAMVASDRINDITSLNVEKNQADRTLSDVEQLEVLDVDFRYGNRELTLNGVSLTVKQGEKIAIVGESGSGKTTLVQLLLKFYEPEKGTVLINGNNIDEYQLDSLRKAIAYVPQSTFLLADTIRNNLKLGNPNATDEEITNVCKLCEIDEFITKLPRGYDFPLIENGANLSGGQRQRIAIARALLQKPKVLILDEATSNLDTITETAIKNTIFGFDTKLTCIIIAHRLTTTKNCDRIYVMDQGSVVEAGTHSALLQAQGRYAALWNVQ